MPEVTPSEPFALFDGDDGSGLLLSGYCRAVFLDPEAQGGDALGAVFSALEEAGRAGQWVALACDYELGASFEPSAPRYQADRPLLRAWVFDRARWLDAEEVAALLSGYLSGLTESQRVAGVADVVPALAQREYEEKVEQVRRWIADGDCYQINLTFPLTFRYFGHPVALYAALRQRQPVRYGACIAVPGATVLSRGPLEPIFAARGPPWRRSPKPRGPI